MNTAPKGFTLVFTHIPRQLEMFEYPNWHVFSNGKHVFITGPRLEWRTSWSHLMSMKMGINFTGEIPMQVKVGITALTRRSRG